MDASNTIYVGTDIGVFVRASGMSDWQPFYNLLPKAPVSELMVNNTTGRIIACTFGRGNFYADLYSTCPATLGIAGTMSGSRYWDASDNITSTATATQGAGNNVAFKAGNYVRLDPGFEIKNNSEFRAYIGPCGTGGIPINVQDINDDFPTDNLYVAAANGVRYPFAKITSILEDKSGANLEVITAGNYSLRITNADGKVVKLVTRDKALTPGETIINWVKSDLAPGVYYAQLFKDKQLVHFQQVVLR